MNEVHGVWIDMRALFAAVALLTGCAGPRLVFRSNREMSREEQLKRADLVFIGLIQRHHVESWPRFQFTHPEGDMWGVTRREVMIEHVLRGTESRRNIDVFEIEWTGGRNGEWNTTNNGSRYLFLVRRENGRYHVVGDYWRSIYPISSGRHGRLPLDESHSLWERIALMNWWLGPDADVAGMNYHDPAEALSVWRVVKLERGLVRHPNSAVRVAACYALLQLPELGQDECWDGMTSREREELANYSISCSATTQIAVLRESRTYMNASQWWSRHRGQEWRRVVTAIDHRERREQFCRLWQRDYPDDHDNGCPADRPPPATIVTDKGDVPLIGAWPRR